MFVADSCCSFAFVRAMAMATAAAVEPRGAKRSRSVELDLDAERVTRRRLQEENAELRDLVAKRDSEITRLKEELRQQESRADGAQRRAAAAARRVAAADARAEVSERRAVAAIREAEARAAAATESAAAGPSEPSSSEAYAQPECPVCLQQIYDEDAWILSCGHATHERCKDQLARNRHVNCPFCRARVL